MPEQHGIYDTRSFMQALAMWVQDTGRTTFTRAELPDHFKCKWFKRAGYNKEICPIDKTCRGAKAWRLGAKWQAMVNAGPIKPRQEITDELLIETVAAGVTTYAQLQEELSWSAATIFRYLVRLVDEGQLAVNKQGRRHVYAVVT